MTVSIALISQTGNVMKTTLAAALAIRFAADDVNTVILDLDREHHLRGASIADWFEERRRLHADRPAPIVTTPNSAQEALDSMMASGLITLEKVQVLQYGKEGLKQRADL